MAKTNKSFNYWQWRIIIVSMVCYAIFYFVRKNFSIAMPGLTAEYGISNTSFGIIIGIGSLVYGLARFINGFIVDKVSTKAFMALGLFLCAVANFCFGFGADLSYLITGVHEGPQFVNMLILVMGVTIILNQYFQGMGYPPCARMLPTWIAPGQLATKMSIWNTSHSIGAGLVVVLCGFLLKTFGYSAWNLCFIVPAALALIGVPVIFFGIKDSPTEVGLPPVEKMGADGAAEKENTMSKELQNKIMRKMVFQNPVLWIIALANFCMNVIRGTILDWGGTFLVQDKGFDISVAGSVIGSCELIGGILGMLVSGWVTDRFFAHKAHRTCLVCMVMTTVCFALFWGCSGTAATIIFLLLSAFFIYGPQALYGTCASMQCTKYAAGTGNGLIGILGYLSTFVSGIWFGHVASSVLGWERVYIYTIAFGVLGSLIIALIWKVPADGYAKVERIIAENGE